MTTTAAPARTAGALPLKYVAVAFAFTWAFWWLAVLDARGLISLPIPVILIGAFGPWWRPLQSPRHISSRGAEYGRVAKGETAW